MFFRSRIAATVAAAGAAVSNRHSSRYDRAGATWSLAAVLGGGCLVSFSQAASQDDAPQDDLIELADIDVAPAAPNAPNAPNDANDANVADSAKWRSVIASCIPAVVAIKAQYPRSFDTNNAGSSQATGFVVDAARGILLTNRHVVRDGPIVAEAVFQDHEEVPLTPLYRDPVHDFAFFKFDPAKIKHMRLAELPLKPAQATVGTEIRVLGNNAGEKLSILGGTIARTDRNAPNTGVGTDFNTNYIQAASGTSGGSSGSPVIDQTGAAVALNAAGRVMTSVSFYLPLERVKRALELLQQGQPVPRGTIQTIFSLRGFGELHTLGLDETKERALRAEFPQASGLLTVSKVLPGGAGEGLLEPGDMLVAVGDKTVTTFVELEAELDNAVGGQIQMTVLRGPVSRKVSIAVKDLHAITPSTYVECGDCVFHDLSYHVALAHHLPLARGVYVAQAGHMLSVAGVPAGSIITRVGTTPTPDLQAFVAALAALPDGSTVPVTLFNVKNKLVQAQTALRIERRFFPFQWVTRTPAGQWETQPVLAPPLAAASASTLPPSPIKEGPVVRSTTFPAGSNSAEKALQSSLVYVRFNMPYFVDSSPVDSFHGTGVVVDANNGLVLVDRSTVPASLGNITLSFANSIEIPAKVLFIHPLHNMAVLQYDPVLIGTTPVKSATFANTVPSPNQSVWLIGLAGNQRTGVQMTSVHGRVGAGLGSAGLKSAFAANMDAVEVKGITANQDGVILDADGKIVALWAAFHASSTTTQFLGVPAKLILDILKPLTNGENPRVYSLGARLDYMGLISARSLGLDDESALQLENAADKRRARRQVLVVSKRWHGTAARELFQDGDMLLDIDGVAVLSCSDVDDALRGRSAVNLTVCRDGKRVTVELAVYDPIGGHFRGVDELLQFGGALIQRPPPVLSWSSAVDHDCCYVSACRRGSPAEKALPPGSIIVEVDGVETPTVDSLASVLLARGADSSHLRVKYRTLKGTVRVTSMCQNEFWPLLRMKMDASSGEWVTLT